MSGRIGQCVYVCMLSFSLFFWLRLRLVGLLICVVWGVFGVRGAWCVGGWLRERGRRRHCVCVVCVCVTTMLSCSRWMLIYIIVVMYRIQHYQWWRDRHKTWKCSGTPSTAWIWSTSIQDISWWCWHPILSLVWQRRRLQCACYGSLGPFNGGFIQLLQTALFVEDCTPSRWSIGK